MLVIARGYPLNITYLRPLASVSVTASGCACVNPATGKTVATPTVANDSTNTSLISAVSRRDVFLQASGLSVSTSYELTTSNGKRSLIYIIGVSGNECELRDALPYDMIATGTTIKGIECNCTISLTSAFTEDSALIRWTLSNGLIAEEEIQITNQLALCPVTVEHIYTKWPRMRGYNLKGQGGDSLQPQIDYVWGTLRDRLWSSKLMLDKCKRPSVFKEYILAELAFLLTDAGFNISGANDLSIYKTEITNGIQAAWISALSSNNLWFDENDNDIEQDDETGSIMRLIE